MTIVAHSRLAIVLAALGLACALVTVALLSGVPLATGYWAAEEITLLWICIAGSGLLFAAGLARCYEWFACEHFHFSFGKQTLGSRTSAHYCLKDFVSVEEDGGAVLLRMADGSHVRIPDALKARTGQIVATLMVRRGEFGIQDQFWNPSLSCQSAWPDPFLHQYQDLSDRTHDAESYDEAIVDDPNALRALIARYRKAVIFHDALPRAFELAKLFTTLRESNGGLVLLGVSPDGSIVGLNDEDLRRAREKLEHLAARLTEARVEIGRIELQGKVAAFAVFNLIPSHLRPMAPFEKATSEVVVV